MFCTSGVQVDSKSCHGRQPELRENRAVKARSPDTATGVMGATAKIV